MTKTKEILNAELAKLSDDEIAKILAETPEETDISTNSLAREIIYNEKDPCRWAEICRTAGKNLETTKERRIALAIEEVNGLRRIPGIINIYRINIILIYIDGKLWSLPEGKRKERLTELYFYNAGIVYSMIGDFKSAVITHEKEASMATSFGRLNAIYMASMCTFNQSIIDGKAIESSYEEFRKSCGAFIKILDKNNSTQARWIANIECNLRRADILVTAALDPLVKRYVTLRETSDKVFAKLPEEVQKIFPEYVKLLKAWEEIISAHIWTFGEDCQKKSSTMEKLQHAEDLACDVAGNEKNPVDWRCDALVITALAQLQHNKINKTKTTLKKLINLKGYGGYAPKAIAERLLKSLE
ncbi:MAG: hypothetical protein Q7T34_02220 [Candidatus Parcubacteria bacterium]|nr:hypothetical protein [Candidatus Parcubacteria bacterium]